MRDRLTERITDVYLITMLLLFPLFFGFSGYTRITISKFIFLLAATGACLAALLIAAMLRRVELAAPRPVQTAAIALALIAVLSWLCCGDLRTAFIGAGRYDGLLSTLVYVSIFLCVSAFSRPKPLHFRAFSLALALLLLIALLQLAGRNPLHLFPRDLGFYDHDIQYSGVYLGTIGNTNVLDAILCLALPLLFSLYVCEIDWYCLVPAALAVPVLWKAGGDGLKLSMLLTALALPPFLLTDLNRVRRAMRALAWLLLSAAFGAFWQPSETSPLRFALSGPVVLLLAAAIVLGALSHYPLPASFAPSPKTLRRFFALLSCAALLAGILLLFAVPWSTGALSEFRQLLLGRADDSFGSSRIRIWRACLGLVPARPLLGCGPGMLAANLEIEFSRYVPETGKTLRSYVDNAHNVYLGILVNTGALGLAAHLTTLGLAAAEAVRRRDDPLRLALSAGLFCAALHAFFGLGLCLSEPLFWLALGMLCAKSGNEISKTP